MPQLDVPLFKQPEGSGECGLASLAMIHAYYKTGVDYERLRQELLPIYYAPEDSLPSLSTMALGEHLQKHGFTTKLITANPRMFYAADLSAKPAKVREIFDAYYASTKDDRGRKILDEVDGYLKAGGEIEVAIPAIEHINREIDAKAPLIAAGATRFIHSSKLEMNFHFTVVTGYDDAQIYANDPDAEITENQYGCRHDLWFYSIIAATYADIDVGCLLSIRPN